VITPKEKIALSVYVQERKKNVEVSLVIPAYNEEKRLGNMLCPTIEVNTGI